MVQPRQFIAGPENALLGILVSAISTRPPLFNPITLYGPTGVGKSHLLEGVVERQRTLGSSSRALSITGSDFARGFARAIELDSVSEWRDRNRRVDLFVLDDLQELSTKPSAQQEFLHTLDALVDQDQQLLIASRHAPLEWSWMSPGLRSRLEGGLIIPVVPPAEETQQFMVTELALRHGLPPGAEPVLQVSCIPRTYPQIQQSLLHCLQRLAGADAAGSDVTVRRKSDATQKESLVRIAKLVARQSQIKLSDMLGPSRRQTIVRARGIAVYLARTLLNLSFDDLGEYFGGRDHTTVLHSWRKTMERLEADVRFKHEIHNLLVSLASNFEVQKRLV
jgi:chromosomal replication initiator protein